MEVGKKYFIILMWVFFVHGIGVWLFTKGFLLKRVMIHENSTCHANFSVKAENEDEGCWMHKTYEKAVIIIIDALRFDFVAPVKHDEYDEEYSFQNKLKVVHELLKKHPQNTRLYKFLADPPTTTLQRLKGLTTGSLPTFVDAGTNFASSEITEDNVIDHMVRRNKSITFMGDDTWMGLFPGRFTKSFPFPSLNVKDLHTVDNGILKHLVPELHKKDWDVLIAHFLGVDHCGHRYGPYHPAMSEKLTQMDEMLRSVIKALGDDTILFVLGDHGMTRTGDHGGDSSDELASALFVYSHSKLTSSPSQKGRFSARSQIDFVPTLSLLLGLPIPFSNLGSLIPHLFNHNVRWENANNRIQQVYHSVKSLRLNAHQVRNYLKAYAQVSDEFPHIQFAELDLLFNQCESLLQEMATMIQIDGDEEKNIIGRLRSARESFLQYLQDVKGMCQSIWAKFDLSCLLLGSVTLVSSALLLGNLLMHTDITRKVPVLMYVGMVGSGWVVLFVMFLYSVGLGTTGLVASLSLGFPAIVISTHVISRIIQVDPDVPEEQQNKAPRTPGLLRNWDEVDLFATLCVFLYMAGVFSNSYVIQEDTTSAFFLQSLTWGMFFRTSQYLAQHQTFQQSVHYAVTKRSKSWRFDVGRIITSPRSLLLMNVIVFNVLIRLAINFRACREEQWSCDLSNFMQPLAALTGTMAKYKNVRYFFSVICMVTLPWGLQKWLRHYGNLNGYSPMVLMACYALPLACACVTFHWALQGLPQNILDATPPWQIVLLSRIVYAMFILLIFFIVIKPLTLFIVKDDEKESLQQYVDGVPNETLVPKVYNHLKMNLQKHLQKKPGSSQHGSDYDSLSNSEKEPPMVYGLATVYSSTILILSILTAIMLAMLLGDGLAPSILLQMAAMICLLELQASYINIKYKGYKQDVTWGCIAMWGFLSSYFFYTTGHQATITSIRWEAAYNGFYGDFDNYAIPATLITLNTYASLVLSTIMLPLLVCWPYVRGRTIFVFEAMPEVFATPDRKGEFLLNEEPWRLRSSMFRAIIGFLFFHGFKMVSTACAAGLHRRHLMVWKIFAPHFIFEGAGFILLAVLVVLVYFLVLRIDTAIDKWIYKNL